MIIKPLPHLSSLESIFDLILATSPRVKRGSLFLATFLLVSQFQLTAQEKDDSSLTEKSLPKTLNAARKQVPTDPKAVAEIAEFLVKNVPAAPLPAGSSKLDAMRARALQLQKQHAQFSDDVASGKVNPFAHLIAARPQQIEDLKALTISLREINTEIDPVKKEALLKAVFIALQPIGSYLEIAEPGKGYTNILSKDQQAELTRLEAAWDTADQDYDTKNLPLHFIGSGQLYTLTNLAVPLTVKAPPLTKVIFQTHGGGFFSNKLALIEVEANNEGFATADWVTYGDSIGDTVITARSASAPPAQNLTITTVQLKLSALPELPKNSPNIPNPTDKESNLKNQLESKLESTNEE